MNNSSTHYLQMCMKSSKNIASNHHNDEIAKSIAPSINSLTLFASPWELQHHHHQFEEHFLWPPRSYRCNFCRREFRSAQALGGHMNVHRRDRARLKHQMSTQNVDHHQKEHVTTTNNNVQDNSLIVFTCLHKEHVQEQEPFTKFKKHKKSLNGALLMPLELSSSSSSSSGDHVIDLELRLGDPPVIK